MQANMKSRSMVTSTIFPMVLTATNTHWTTCYRGREMIGICEIRFAYHCFVLFCFFSKTCFTFRPLALLMALRGLNTLKTLKIFTTEIALDLQKHITKWKLMCYLWEDEKREMLWQVGVKKALISHFYNGNMLWFYCTNFLPKKSRCRWSDWYWLVDVFVSIVILDNIF